MSTLRTYNLQNPDSSNVNIELTQGSGAVVAGVTTFSSNVNVSGNLTVDGELTYDDVTNIDSIGIITARSDIRAQGNIIGDNSTNISGINSVTATKFYGDGSQLTGIDATQIVTGNTSVQTVDTGSDGHVKVNTEGTERLRIKSDGKAYFTGNLGLGGQTSPSGTIHINDFSANGYELKVTGNALQFNRSSNSYIDQLHNSGSILFRMTSSNTEAMRITSDGKVGINDTSPAALFTVNNGTNDSQCVSIKNDNVGAYFGTYGTGHGSYPREVTINGTRTDGGSSPFLRIAGQGGIKFCVDLNTERMRITSGGVKQVLNGNLNIYQTYIDFSGDQTSTPQTAVALYRPADGTFAISTQNTERVRITSDGKMGVGCTPETDFQVRNGNGGLLKIGGSGTGATGFQIQYNNSGNTTTEILTNYRSTSASASLKLDTGTFLVATGTSGTERLRIDSSGRLLLGTTTEGYVSADNFTIADTGNCGLTIRSASNALGTIAFSDATSGDGEYSGFIQYNHGNRHLTFGTESDDHVRIDNNGHLEVDYDGSNNARVQFGFASGVWITGNSSDGHQRFYTNSNVRILSGYNGQGTEFHNQNSVRPGADNSIDLGSGSYRYDDVYATNGTIQTSDSRLKQEVVTSVLGIDFVKALRPVSYKWIEGKKVPIVDSVDENGDNVYRSDDNGNWAYESRAGARRHWGFIAQEVKQAVDDAGVDFAGWSLTDKDDPDSTQSLRYEEFIAPLTKALQEVIAKNEALEARIAALEG